MQTLIPRKLQADIEECLKEFPVVAILGPRQCGKSTLAKHLLKAYPGSLYLDLERASDRKRLADPELFFCANEHVLACLDEIQRLPDIFVELRSIVDRRNRQGQFIILGSASPDLIRQSAESLAGRIAYLELTPFTIREICDHAPLEDYWMRGGFPPSFLSRNNRASIRWRDNFIRTFLERDIPQLGVRIPGGTIERFWQMCAHLHGQLLNASAIGNALGLSHTTVRNYLDILAKTFLLRQLRPCAVNLKKRMVKSPKIYLRDTGLLHSILEIEDFNHLLGHPVFGASWEGLVIETAINLRPGWRPVFFRTSDGTEIDLVLEKGRRRICIECKASSAPKIGKGFHNAIAALNPEKTFVVAPVETGYPITANTIVCNLLELCEFIENM